MNLKKNLKLLSKQAKKMTQKAFNESVWKDILEKVTK